jgi:hypothetical protein
VVSVTSITSTNSSSLWAGFITLNSFCKVNQNQPSDRKQNCHHLDLTIFT